MKKMELSQMENLEGGRKFWGKEYDFANATCFFGELYVPYTQYVLGIDFGGGVENTGVSCG